MKYRMKRHAVVQPLDQSIKLIPLTQGQNAIVDATDFEWLSQWNWFYSFDGRNCYAQRKAPDGKSTIFMHREILGCMPSEKGDHVNHQTLDNRRANLRKASIGQNTHNQRKQKRGTTSKYKGVYWKAPRENKWVAQIKNNGKRFHLGYFAIEEDAARAYDAAAIKLHGKFASLNFPS